MLISEGEACCCALLPVSIALNIVTALFLPQKGDLLTLQNDLISLLLFAFVVIFFFSSLENEVKTFLPADHST